MDKSIFAGDMQSSLPTDVFMSLCIERADVGTTVEGSRGRRIERETDGQRERKTD